MAEYIERNAFRKTLLIGEEYLDEDTMLTVINLLDCAPAADVVEVVRCKDCKYGEKDEGENVLSYFCQYDGCDWNYGNHFCSYGERRNDAAD